MSKQFKRIIFSDIDGTIYPFSNRVLSEETKKSILDSYNDGVEFVLATGNPALPKIQDLANELNARYIICSNGAEILDLQDKKYLFYSFIDEDSLTKILNICNKYNAAIYWNSLDKYGLFNASKSTIDFYVDFYDFKDWDFTNHSIKRVLKLEILDNNNSIEQIKNDIVELNLPIEMVKLSSHIEITTKQASKGNAAQFLCENIFNTDIKNTMAIGDSENDLSMLSMVGFGYAMDNAPQSVKSKCVLFAADVEQNGLGESIIDYVYRTKSMYEKEKVRLQVEKWNDKLKAKNSR
ncbi:Hypothetical protein, putative HAD hydrolase [Mycoplasmopsis bovigenitalium 51080]|uniref:COF family HAD hydrolase protein n=1 Tax=Mycoplasmopsis bovigenitalium 51080 TaxID=1188235 RepID=N9TTZ0_9BACT|nr:Cof-type HAD-IIB family hydrolase [Mycoplasmopsis bovigenitalium]ENY69599.1 Hypothetical protein, putative HAD hydrolase [Mycoplasmopsis bovigenitalium 51080]